MKYKELTKKLEAAKAMASRYANDTDGGASNFDAVCLDYKKMHLQKQKTADAILAAGLMPYPRKKLGRNIILIDGFGQGQGTRNTRMNEAAYSYLKNQAAAAVLMHYELD